MLKKLAPLPAHPLLFTAFFVLALYSQNMLELTYTSMLPSLGVSLGLALLCLLLSLLLLKNMVKAAILATVALVLFFTYGHVFNLINNYAGAVFLGLFLTYVAVFLIALYLVVRTKNNLWSLTKALNIVSASMVLVSLVVIIPFEITSPISVSDGNETLANTTSVVAPSTYPDIYYIIWDGFPSAHAIDAYYEFDLNFFTEWLDSRGFYVASESHSNYGSTIPSMASSLDMEYLTINNPEGDITKDGKLLRQMPQMIRNSKVSQIFKALGYTYIALGSSWNSTRGNDFASVSFSPTSVSGFPYLLARSSMIRAIPRLAGVLRLSSTLNPRFKQYADATFQLNKLAEVPDIVGNSSRPVFAFIHMMIPHEPLVFSQEGEYVPQEAQSVEGLKAQYQNQLLFAIKQIQIAVDNILAKSERPPIIILQGDHGMKNSVELYCYDDLSAEEQKTVSTGILNAYYLPEGCANLLYPSISPVNTFRLIFNCYFRINYTLLSDYY